jgi:hypothetical protein
MQPRSPFFAKQSPVPQEPGLGLRIGATGDTLLHLTCRYNPLAKLKLLLQFVSEEKLRAMAKTVNHQGKLPIQDLENNSSPSQDKEEMASLLLPFTLSETSKPREFLSVWELKKIYPNSWSDPLYHHFKVACTAYNQVRQKLEDSGTHPSSNSYETARAKELDEKIHFLRAEIKEHRKRIRKIYCPAGKFSLTKEKFIFDKIVGLIQKAKVGNCTEFSILGLAALMRLDKTLYAEVYQLVNNDHVFIVLGRDPSSDEADPKTWGKNAVICDFWAGEIFKAEDLPQKLRVYFQYKHQGKSYNLLGFYNPAFHKLEVYSAYNKKTKLTSETYQALTPLAAKF